MDRDYDDEKEPTTEEKSYSETSIVDEMESENNDSTPPENEENSYIEFMEKFNIDNNYKNSLEVFFINNDNEGVSRIIENIKSKKNEIENFCKIDSDYNNEDKENFLKHFENIYIDINRYTDEKINEKYLKLKKDYEEKIDTSNMQEVLLSLEKLNSSELKKEYSKNMSFINDVKSELDNNFYKMFYEERYLEEVKKYLEEINTYEALLINKYYECKKKYEEITSKDDLILFIKKNIRDLAFLEKIINGNDVYDGLDEVEKKIKNDIKKLVFENEFIISFELYSTIDILSDEIVNNVKKNEFEKKENLSNKKIELDRKEEKKDKEENSINEINRKEEFEKKLLKYEFNNQLLNNEYIKNYGSLENNLSNIKNIKRTIESNIDRLCSAYQDLEYDFISENVKEHRKSIEEMYETIKTKIESYFKSQNNNHKNNELTNSQNNNSNDNNLQILSQLEKISNQLSNKNNDSKIIIEIAKIYNQISNKNNNSKIFIELEKIYNQIDNKNESINLNEDLKKEFNRIKELIESQPKDILVKVREVNDITNEFNESINNLEKLLKSNSENNQIENNKLEKILEFYQSYLDKKSEEIDKKIINFREENLNIREKKMTKNEKIFRVMLLLSVILLGLLSVYQGLIFYRITH